MKMKSFLCLTLATIALTGGGTAIGKGILEANALGKDYVDSSISVPFIDFSPVDRSDDILIDPSDSNSFLPIRPPFVLEEEEEEEDDVEPLPSHYCMRDEYVVYAQHQDKEGYCWNFASTMSAATTIMRHTGEYYDFSEAWSGLTSLYANTGYTNIGAGGTFSYQNAAIKYGGLMLETDFPYEYTYTISNENADDYYNFFKQYANDSLVDCLTKKSFSVSKVDQIKQHIYNYGSAYAAFTFRKGYEFDENGVSVLPPNQTNTNSAHAVSIIGWDDNYERTYYLNGSDTPTVFKGAWLILNSFTETSGVDGISLVFYNDKNLYDINGYTYEQKTNKDLYFYDKIEEGYAYPNTVKGKYCGDFTAQAGETKQKNIFYDDVDLEYSYTISEGASVDGISIYLDNVDVTKQFNVRIDEENQRFYISKEAAQYGQYKVLVSYGNGKKSDTYLNNFFVTYGLMGEKQEFDTEANGLAFNTGRDLEYYSIARADKNYAIYTNQKSGTLSFLPIHQSIYSDKNMSIPALSYEITDGKATTATHTITSTSGYALTYNFHVEYYEDTTLQPVNVYYDVEGGVNHPSNYAKELASESTDLVLYTPTREGYVFDGWYLNLGDSIKKLDKKGDAYCLSWEDIHHMGESPSMYASSYYKKYYSNSNVVFVYASWVEAEYYDVQTEVVGKGNIASTGNNTMTCFDVVTYTFTPSEGYKIKDVILNGESIGAVSSYTFADVYSDQTLRVEFEIIKNDVDVSVDGQGSVSSDNTLTDILFGEGRTLTLTPEKGWKVSSVFINGERVEIGNNQLVLEHIKEDAHVVVVFKQTLNIPLLIAIISLSATTLIGPVIVITIFVKKRKKGIWIPLE